MEKEIIEKLDMLWKKHPEQRLGQLLKNYIFNEEISMWELGNKEILKKLDKELR